MITGKVNAHREAVITLELVGADHKSSHVDAVIDSGFSGFVTLPKERIRELGLRMIGTDVGLLANGSETIFDVYGITIVWYQKRHRGWVLEAEGQALVGMSLLDGSRLTIDVVDNGEVVVEPIA